MIIKEMIYDLISWKHAKDYEEEPKQQKLSLYLIRPEDVPQKDETFPRPPPNKRVIIIDI